MSPESDASPAMLAAPPVVRVEQFTGDGRRAFGTRYQNVQLVLTTLIFALSVPALWLFGYTFWVFLETLAQVAQLPRGQSGLAWLLSHLPRAGLLTGAYGWTLDGAFLLGTLATWALLYFAFDYLPLVGNRAAQAVIAAKIAALPAPPDTRTHRFWVELRPHSRRTRLTPDVGYLYLLPGELRFFGDVERITIPQSCVVHLHPPRGGRGGVGTTYVPVRLSPPWNDIRLVGRGETRTVSGTRQDTHNLATALAAWYTESIGNTPPARE